MTTPPSFDQIFRVAVSAAERAAAVIRERRASHSVTISFKAARDLVTTTDVEAEQTIIATIREHFPDHLVLAEETAQTVAPSAYAGTPTWVIDPIDGTTNFAHGHPHCGISIGFAIDAITRVGVVLSPFSNELFHAVKGQGAFLNGDPIRVSEAGSIDHALVATGFPYGRDNVDPVCTRLRNVLAKCRDIRRLGAASLDISWVACGRLDAFYEETLMPWDGVAGCLIAREAGAVVGRYAYSHQSQRRSEAFPGDLCMDNVIVATPGVFPELQAILEKS